MDGTLAGLIDSPVWLGHLLAPAALLPLLHRGHKLRNIRK